MKQNMMENKFTNYSAHVMYGSEDRISDDKQLRDLPNELSEVIRNIIIVDWSWRESIRSDIRLMATKTLGKYLCLLNEQKKMIETVLQQTEIIVKNGVRCDL